MAPIAITPPFITVKKLPVLIEPRNKRGKIICFSDFDGTIFMQGTGHILFDRFGCGSKKRQILDEQISTGERSFRDVSEELSFHAYCLENSIPFTIISAGLKPVLRRVLDVFLGEDQSRYIDIVANDADINDDGSKWKLIWRHDSELGHDEALSIQEARTQAEADLAKEDDAVPLIVFIGDGVSDLPAASQADVLFARRRLRLEMYCLENDIAYIPFDTFAGIQKELVEVMEEDEQVTAGKGRSSPYNPLAKVCRRESRSTAVPQYVVISPSEEDNICHWPETFIALKTPAVEVTMEIGILGQD